MAAILQFEIDRKRVDDYPRDGSSVEHGSRWKYRTLLKAALYDTLENGGTFVLVASETKITAVQHAEAQEFECEGSAP